MSSGAGAAPQGGQVVSGSGSISASGATTTINQASDKLSLNWQSFNVGMAETVNFVQPSASALAVNRIFDTQGSQILGRINANGQVWLINPNGVLFGKDAQINVGGLLASTLNPDDASIGSTRSNFSGSSTASVVNLGSISTTQGGYVALLGHSVSNQGSISAPGGTVAMGTGSAVSLNFAGSKLLGLEVTSNQVNALAENGGLIQADGGQVLLSAGARESLLASVVNNTGVIQARTVQEKDGKIILLGGMASGTTNVSGTLDASAPSGGNGGFIETSAAHVNVAKGTVVTTKAASGRTGQWLIDPNDFTIAASGGNIDAETITSNLSNTNFEISTATMGTDGGNGDIFVNQDLSWTSTNTLTLTAERHIELNGTITAANGGLTLTAGRDANNQGTIRAPYAVSVGKFNLTRGIWRQLASSLPSFSATSFQLSGGTFIRALGGDGSNSSPYRITDVYGLQGIGSSSTTLTYHYALANDINASGTSSWNGGSGFSPIANYSYNINPTAIFTGTFDGLGHTITGLTINRSSSDYAGLFGYVGTGGAVKNVGLSGGSVTGGAYVGGLVGLNDGTISGSHAKGMVSGDSYIGGLVGWNNGTISGSYAEGNVSGNTHIGGLVGLNGGAILTSYSLGAIRASDESLAVGGLVGWNDGTISGSYATGSINADWSVYVGGLVGFNNGEITNSYATGSVNGAAEVGGLVGYNNNDNGTISNSYFDKGTTGQADGVGSDSSASGVTGLTTVDAFKQTSYIDLDFTNTWYMVEDVTRPLLRAFLTPLPVAPNNSASGAGSNAVNSSGPLANNDSSSQSVGNTIALTPAQSASVARLVPVVNPPSLPSDTSFVKPAPLPQASLPFNVAENINTLPATAAGSVPSTSLNVTKAFGSSGMLFAQGNGVRFPATYYQSTLADPAQNP